MHITSSAEHAQHDLDLIAGHAAGDLPASERPRADLLLQSCTTCAELRRDLLAIAEATRALPRTAPAPRDFRIDAAQADRLRGGGWLRSLLRPFRAPGPAFRPMATAFTTLGLAGLLVANILPGLFGNAGAAAPLRDQTGSTVATAGAAPAASGAPVLQPVAAGAGGPSATSAAELQAGQPTAAGDQYQVRSQAGGTPAPVAAAPGSVKDSSAPDRFSADSHLAVPAPLSPLVLGSIVLLALGLALFGLRFAARRLG